jgi:hypothetical protein
MEFPKFGFGCLRLVCGVPLERRYLSRLRRVARRCGAWFRVEAEDRRFLDLVIMVVEGVRSGLLARVLEPVLGRLLEALGGFREAVEALFGRVAYLMLVRGRPMALRLSQLAQGWGNRQASCWAEDKGFIRYLAVMELNRPKIWS